MMLSQAQNLGSAPQEAGLLTAIHHEGLNAKLPTRKVHIIDRCKGRSGMANGQVL